MRHKQGDHTLFQEERPLYKDGQVFMLSNIVNSRVISGVVLLSKSYFFTIGCVTFHIVQVSL